LSQSRTKLPAALDDAAAAFAAYLHRADTAATVHQLDD
jgi:hypothetical protein